MDFLDEKRHHEQEKYEHIAGNRDSFNGYGANAHGASLIWKIKELSPKSICDVGTATGRFCIMLEDEGIEEVIGVDFAFVPEGGRNIRWIKAFAHDMPIEDKSVDYVTAFDFLEHVLPEEVNEVLDEFRRISKKGFMFSVSYKESCHSVGGENLHMTVRSKEWWHEKFKEYGEVEVVGNFFIVHCKNEG